MKNSKEKLGFFGGSFDPIHFGHINLALEIQEKFQLDKVLFCPAYMNPKKLENREIMSVHHRLEMVKIAIQDIPCFECIDIEAKCQAPSYTVETLKLLNELYPNGKLYLILGLDAANQFSEWKNPSEILSFATPVVGLRASPISSQKLTDPLAFKMEVVKTRLLDISSTDVRDRIKKNSYIKHLVPSKVVDYIYQNKLY